MFFGCVDEVGCVRQTKKDRNPKGAVIKGFLKGER